MERTLAAPAAPAVDVESETMEEEGPSGPWPRSSALLVVLIIGFAFGALSFLPLVGGILFYPSGYLSTSPDFVTRSAAGDSLQILYQLLLVLIGYAIGKKVVFERDGLVLLLPAYFGAVLGNLIGIPGLESTTVAGGIYLFQTNTLDPTHIQSAFFNSPTLMGMLVSGLGLAFVFERRSTALAMPGAEDELTSTTRLLLIFVAAAVLSFLAYLMPPMFFVLFKAAAGPTAASTGILYSIETNSSVLANPFLFFAALYLLGGQTKLFRDTSTIVMMLFIAVIVGAIAGNPIGSFVTTYVATGSGTFPNYLANTTILTTFLTAVLAVSFAGTFLGYSGIVESGTRSLVKSGTVPPLAEQPSEAAAGPETSEAPASAGPSA